MKSSLQKFGLLAIILTAAMASANEVPTKSSLPQPQAALRPVLNNHTNTALKNTIFIYQNRKKMGFDRLHSVPANGSDVAPPITIFQNELVYAADQVYSSSDKLLAECKRKDINITTDHDDITVDISESNGKINCELH